MGGELQFVPENQRFGRVALEAVLPYARSVISNSPGTGSKSMRKYYFTPRILVMYIVFVFITFFDFFTPFLFVWPYSLLLSLQKWLYPIETSDFIAADVLGLVAVLLCGLIFDRRPVLRGQKGWKLYALSGLLWLIPLIGLELLVFGIALGLGWPVGE